MYEKDNDLAFALKIDFVKDSKDPARVFRCMSGMIQAFSEFDLHVAKTIDIETSPILLLQDIETGSLVTWLKNSLKGIPDEALKQSEWKRIFGQFLYESRNSFVEWLEQRETISSRGDIQELQEVILEKAEKSNLNRIPAYSPPTHQQILSSASSLKKAMDNLSNNDRSVFIARGEEKNINQKFEISEATIKELLTLREITQKYEAILLVKKPDYLGRSKWLFRYKGHQVEAHITHSEWVGGFQTQEEKVLPGDSIRAKLETTISYGFEGEVVHETYEVVEVMEVIRGGSSGQIGLLLSE
jgi:hypothetical protein